MSATPKTDAAIVEGRWIIAAQSEREYVPADFARDLERATRPASPALDRLKEEIAGILLDINNQRVGWGETQFLRMAEARAHRALRIIEELK